MMTPIDYGITLHYTVIDDLKEIDEGETHALEQFFTQIEKFGPFKTIELDFYYENNSIEDGISLDTSQDNSFTFYTYDVIRYDIGDSGVCNKKEVQAAIESILIPFPSKLKSKQIFQKAVKTFLYT